MPTTNSRKMELLHRRDRTAELYLAGRTQTAIAQELSVGVATVCRDLQWVRQQWLERAVRNFDEIKAEQLARIDWLEQQATAAWLASKENDAEGAADRRDAAQGGHAPLDNAPRREGCGNERYLARIGWCVEQRAKVFGLYAPTKVAPTDPSGNKAFSLDVIVRGLSDDQLKALQEANAQLHRATP
jgi:hypothetical protein